MTVAPSHIGAESFLFVKEFFASLLPLADLSSPLTDIFEAQCKAKKSVASRLYDLECKGIDPLF